MNKNYKCIYDIDNIYTNRVINSDTLIDHYIEVCNETEDADHIGWIIRLKETDRQEEAVQFISEIWNLKLKEIENNKS